MAITGGSHILVFPYPAPGHILPTLDLTHQLALRGLTITILITPKTLPVLTPLLSAHPTTVNTLVLPFPSHPSIPSGVEDAKDLPFHSFKAIMSAFGNLYDPVLDWFRNHPSPPVAIVSDLFLGWTYHLACQLGIHRYTFTPSGALGLCVNYSLWRYLPKRDDPADDNFPVTFSNIPGAPVFPWWQLSTVFRSYIEGDPASEFMKDGLCANLVSQGHIVNSFTEFERVYIDHLKEELGHDRVFAVGPLHTQGTNDQANRGGSSSSEVLSWLDTCDNQTVVYVCFGSQVVLTNKQMEGLAIGLEKSGAKFVWVVKGPTLGHVEDKHGEVPPGFEDRVAGRGFVVRGWAPQLAILSHRAVGAFLSHCGWNSVMEAMVAGVSFLVWPMVADSFCVMRLLVDVLKVATRVCEGDEAVPNSGDLAKLIGDSVKEEGRLRRDRAREFAKVAEGAVREGGSCCKELDRLVAHLIKQ